MSHSVKILNEGIESLNEALRSSHVLMTKQSDKIESLETALAAAEREKKALFAISEVSVA